MNTHSSDNEDAASDHSSSQVPSDRDERQLPGHNPSNVPDDATISNGKNAQKSKKQPKMIGRPQPPRPEYAEIRPANIDDRADGGYINPDNARPRDRRIRWTDAADRQLLIFGFGRDIASSEYQAISDTYPEKPTTKAIQERITKLRVQTRKALKDSGIFDPGAVVRPSAPTPAPATSSPAKVPPKKTGPTSAAKGASTGAVVPPRTGTGTLTPRPQRPQEERVQMPQGSQSYQPHPTQLPPIGPQGDMQSLQNPFGYPLGTSWHSHYAPIPPPTANMVPPPTGSPQPTSFEMGMSTMGGPPFNPYGGQYNAYPISGTYTGSGGMGMGPYQFTPSQGMPGFVPGSFAPPGLGQQQAGATLKPTVPSMRGSSEVDGEDLMARSQRELQAKEAEREARRKAFQPPK